MYMLQAPGSPSRLEPTRAFRRTNCLTHVQPLLHLTAHAMTMTVNVIVAMFLHVLGITMASCRAMVRIASNDAFCLKKACEAKHGRSVGVPSQARMITTERRRGE